MLRISKGKSGHTSVQNGQISSSSDQLIKVK